MQDTKKRILITFGRSFLSLDLARQLHAQGHIVFTADSLRLHVSLFSNAVAQSFTVPSPRFTPDAYLDALVDLVHKERIDLVIPIYEETVHLVKAADRFPSTCILFAPSFDLYETLQNKWLFQEKLRSLKILTLDTVLLENRNDLDALYTAPHHIEYALKPCYSRASQKVKKVHMHGQPPSLEIEPHNPWIAQEWAYGNRYCTYTVCHEGKVYAHAAYPVNYAIEGNSCITFKAVHHPKILEWTTNFVNKVKFTGQIAFDFIEKNDELYAIECNPRATSGLLLFAKKDHLDRAFFRKDKEPIFPKEGTSQQIVTGMLLYGWRKSAKENNRLLPFLKDFFTTKDVLFSLRDLKPLLFSPLVFTSLWIKGKKLGISIADYFTFDHDWNNRLEEAVAKPKQPGF